MNAVRAAIVAAVLLAAGSAIAQEAGEVAQEPEATAPEAEEQKEAQEDEKEEHEGFLFRLTFGLGWAFLRGEGTLAPAIGIRRIDEIEHNSPALNLSMDFGGGFKGFGIHVGGVIERMILRADEPTEMGFTLFGVGGGLSYYFTDYDFYATAQLRFVGMRLYLPNVLCDVELGEKYQSYQGPGFTIGVGKEWFGDNDKGLGLGLQLNYAKLEDGDWMEFDYVSLMLALTFTKF